MIRQYEHYYQVTLPSDLIERYFHSTINRWSCRECGLQWFTPTPLGEGDFYEFLSRYPWYYWEDSWDKRMTIAALKDLGANCVLEVGSGKGQLLIKMKQAGIKACGVEINPAAIEHTRKLGLDIFHADTDEWVGAKPDTIVSLQCVEHVGDPEKVLARYASTASVKHLIIAVPGTQTTLARSSDPLMWPPHHATLWSVEALSKLGDSLGFRTTSVKYQPQDWVGFNHLASLEPQRKLDGLPPWPTRMPGRILFHAMRRLGFSWAANAHTVMVIFERVPVS
jgi:SAM-dependent methyltransferase